MRFVSAALCCVARTLARGAGVFYYLAAGTLGLRELREGVERRWADCHTRESDVTAGLMPWENDLVSKYVRAGDSVLIVGSGTGRELIALADRGYRVTGVDPAHGPNVLARRWLQDRKASAEIVEGFFEDVHLSDRFDVVMFSWCCYSYIPGSLRRISALQKASAHLAKDGRILISYLPAAPLVHPALIRCARMASTLSRSDWRPEPGDIVYPRESPEPRFHYEHRFETREIDAEAVAAGLRVAFRRDYDDNVVIAIVPK